MNRKGVSTYISVLLLIVVVIAGGIMIYGYTMNWFGRLGGEGEMGTLSLDSVSASATDDEITAYIRNIGSSTVTPNTVYVDDVKETIDSGDSEISQGSVGEVVISVSGGLTAGNTYEVKLVCADNTQIAFSVKAD